MNIKSIFTPRTKKILLSVVVVVGMVLPSSYFYARYAALDAQLKNPSALSVRQTQELIMKLGRLMELPSGEEPTVATITDREKLSGQEFFANAQNGDKLIIYKQAKKAIIYRSTTNKIVDVGPVTVTEKAATASAKPVSYSVMLYNGTKTVGLTKRFEQVLKDKAPTLTVIDRDNAKESTYQKSMIVDLGGTKSTEVRALAQALGLEVSTLPSKEATASSDFLIILGTDATKY